MRVILDAENKKLNFKFAKKPAFQEAESLDLAQLFEVDISDRFNPDDEYFPFVAIGNQDNSQNTKLNPILLWP